jgi:hypothetical protein
MAFQNDIVPLRLQCLRTLVARRSTDGRRTEETKLAIYRDRESFITAYLYLRFLIFPSVFEQHQNISLGRTVFIIDSLLSQIPLRDQRVPIGCGLSRLSE